MEMEVHLRLHVYVNGGTFEMGSTDYNLGYNDAYPQHPVNVNSFSISKYEVLINNMPILCNNIGVTQQRQ